MYSHTYIFIQNVVLLQFCELRRKMTLYRNLLYKADAMRCVLTSIEGAGLIEQ